jgi:predicted Zn-dependent protease
MSSPAVPFGDPATVDAASRTASRVVDLARSADPTAEVEVVVEHRELALTRFAGSAIHQNMTDLTATVRVRLHASGRTASATTTRTDDDGLGALVKRVAAAARLCPPDPQWPGLSQPAGLGPATLIDDATARSDPAIRAELVRAFVLGAGGLPTAGYCASMGASMVFLNSAGHHAVGSCVQAAMDAIARTGTGDGVARMATARLSDIDAAVLGARAAAKARATAGARRLEPGRYEVVLEPTAVADVLRQMAIHGFSGKVLTEQQSFVELGVAQLDSSVSIVDDFGNGEGTAMPFDVEGTPRRAVSFVDAGVSVGVAHDRRSAAAAGAISTGHATTDSITAGPFPAAMSLLPSAGSAPTEVDGPAADSAVADLVAAVPRGLLVTDNWYTRVLDPRTLVVTGLTRNGVWLIEDGQITSPVENVRFTQSYPQALGPGAVLGVGTHAVAVPDSAGAMNLFRAPALRLASWNYTGNAAG